MYFLESEHKSSYFVLHFLFFFSLFQNALLYPQLLCVKSLPSRRALVVDLVAPATEDVDEMAEAPFDGSGKGEIEPM